MVLSENVWMTLVQTLVQAAQVAEPTEEAWPNFAFPATSVGPALEK